MSSRSDLGLGVQPARGDAHGGRAVRCVGPTDGHARRGRSACGPNGIRVMSGRGVLEGPRDEDAHRLRKRQRSKLRSAVLHIRLVSAGYGAGNVSGSYPADTERMQSGYMCIRSFRIYPGYIWRIRHECCWPDHSLHYASAEAMAGQTRLQF